MTNEEKAYLAGIIDGEGYIGIIQTRPALFGLRLQIGTTGERLADYLLSIVPEFPLWTHESKNPRYKKALYLTLHGREAQKLLRLVRPWLKLKDLQADVALSFPIRGTGGKALPEDQKLSQAIAYIQMAKLNRKGPERK